MANFLGVLLVVNQHVHFLFQRGFVEVELHCKCTMHCK
jgi:hypothetical protein